jgi:glycosyltransferase involved in cell wall biosynthesis
MQMSFWMSDTKVEALDITVILCTYNRCQSLTKALESLAKSVVPDTTQWEGLVVDNNSSDKTRGVIEEFCRRFPGRFRYLFEPKQGKSNALNLGIREARGEVLAFMDDDVTVETNWLHSLTAPLRAPEWAGAGGRIRPAEAIKAPSWLALEGPHSMAGMLALFDLGDEACEMHRAPFGTNMAFRKSMFENHGGFLTDLGPCPGSEMRNEDIEFADRLFAAGERLWYEPSAIVYHAVPEIRLKKPYYLAFWFDHGRAQVRIWKKKSAVLGIPRRFFTLLKLGLLLLPRALRWMLSINSQERFYYKGFLWMTTGTMIEIWRELTHSPDQGL